MKQALTAFVQFVKGVFSDDDGAPSFSRCATAVMVGFSCGWVTYLVHVNHTLPPFGDLVLYTTSLYAVNRAEGIGTAMKGMFSKNNQSGVQS